MKRWLTHGFIAIYLGVLAMGVGAHAIQFGHVSHPAMYFIVWDMFCGWSAYSNRIHIIGEGRSGDFYEITPGPWGRFKPFGNVERHHYDVLFRAPHRFALNTLRHTDHEPMTRLYVVEEVWPKKFNIPDHLWNRRYTEPKDIQKYFHVQSILAPDGTALAVSPNWLSHQITVAVGDNPRLKADSRRGRAFYAVNPRHRKKGTLQSPNFFDPTKSAPGGPLYRPNAH